ncbi:MAG: hypothetical protein CVT49_07755 [candidate division Zixibacteria bacterium HGW-Zixibacteria-1]|nr:MAG: hypothetical protein CVT49_07755 [candidate division Zixibacteria bacterium HGW-Zixibacteria-1]
MRETASYISARHILAYLMFAGTLLDFAFWVVYFGGAGLSGETNRQVISVYESAFPYADILIGFILMVGGIGLIRCKHYGKLCLLIASSMAVYLGIIDITFYIRQGLYLPLSISSIFELFINAACVLGGTAGLLIACRLLRENNKYSSEDKPRTTAEDNHPAYICSLSFLRLYVITMRPYLFFVSGIAGIAGLALSELTSLASGIMYAVIFLLSYGFGQALTDSMQVDTDSLSSPYRPLVQGKIRRRDVAIVSLGGLFLSGFLLILASWINIVLCTLAIIGLASYTYIKRRWWAGPFYNAWIVALLCLIGFVSGNGSASESNIISPALLLTVLAVFFAYANFVLTGYYKDISADRTTGYLTMPVVFGFNISAIVSDIFAITAIISTALTLYYIYEDIASLKEILPPLILILAGLTMSITAQRRLHQVIDEKKAYRAITPVVHSFILMLSAITTAARPNWTISIIILYAAFVFTLWLRPMKEQI